MIPCALQSKRGNIDAFVSVASTGLSKRACHTALLFVEQKSKVRKVP
jgi:hypothetical protein